jgi:hypothetical protein
MMDWISDVVWNLISKVGYLIQLVTQYEAPSEY